MKKGFTLIELLVVVLIIGVLAAIALPMYNKAVLRSRFAALMPIVKAMNDSNEAYYLEHGQYAINPQDLPVQGQLEYPTGTTLEFGQNMDYAYVLASNPDARNNYIMYQKHSANYPGEIHCEAVTGDELAESICASFGNGTGIGTTLTNGYTTYVIEGVGAGLPTGADDNTQSCDQATAMGLTCHITTNEQGQTEKQICTGQVPNRVCRIRTYNEEGGYVSVTCKASAQDVCTSDWTSSIVDAAGHQLGNRYCSVVAGDGSCSEYDSSWDYTYDANGNLLTQRGCYGFMSGQINSDGKCNSYEYGSDSVYDEAGNKIRNYSCEYFRSDGSCNGYNFGEYYTYDTAGHQTSMRECFQVSSNGSCTRYDYEDGNGYDYTYDAAGNILTMRYCEAGDSNGNCTLYTRGANYTYDANGNRLTSRTCSNMDSSGNCTAYSYTYNYTYDANGNNLSQRQCSSVASDGSCSVYSNSYAYDYTYDANGNKLSQRQCSSVASDGSCSAYSNSNAIDYTYDANGNILTKGSCSSVDNSGNCTAYGNVNYYTYDDNGRQLMEQRCAGSNVNMSTGECMAYNNTSVRNEYNN